MTLPDFLTLPRDLLHALRLTIDAADDAVQHLPASTTITFHLGGRIVFEAAMPTWAGPAEVAPPSAITGSIVTSTSIALAPAPHKAPLR